MNTPMMSLREQFVQKHGDDCLNIEGILFFSDGATMERASYGAVYEPPSDPWQLAKVKLRYREERLRRATAKFNEMKQQLSYKADEAIRWARANTPPSPPSADEVKELEALRDRVHQCQADVVAARAAVDANTPEFLRRREEVAAANVSRNSEAKTAVTNVKI